MAKIKQDENASCTELLDCKKRGKTLLSSVSKKDNAIRELEEKCLTFEGRVLSLEEENDFLRLALTIITGLPYGKPSLEMEGICSVFFTGLPYTAIPVGKWVEFLRFIFFRVGKSLAYFLRIERVVEMRTFLWWTQ